MAQMVHPLPRLRSIWKVLLACWSSGIVATAGAASPPAALQERLEEKSTFLPSAYVPADQTAKYGYLEVEYPASFKSDGRGSLKTKPPIQSHSQTISDEARDWLSRMAPALDRDPQDLRTLELTVKTLAGQQQKTRLVPFADRFLAAGGKLGYPAMLCYIDGLARLGRTSEALKLYQQAVQKWGVSMTENMAGAFFSDRFMVAWLVERDFQEMLSAYEQACLNGIFPADANSFQETLVGMLRQAGERKELGWFVPRWEKHWIYLNDVYVKSAAAILEKNGVPPPEALAIALDPVCKGSAVPPQALCRRAIDSLNRGESEQAVRQVERALELSRRAGLKSQFRTLSIVNRVFRQRGDLERTYEFTAEAERVAKQINERAELGWALIMKGFLLEKVADYRGAADCHAQAYRIGESLEYSELSYTGKFGMARSLSHTGLAERVEPTLREFAQGSLEHRLFTKLPGDFMNWGECLLQLGNYDAALSAYRQALSPVKEAGSGYTLDLNIQLACTRGMAYALLAQKKYADAEKVYGDYAKLASQSLTESSAWVWQLGMARCKVGQKQYDAAREAIDECLKSIELERASLSDFHHRRSLNDNKYGAYELAIALDLARGEVESAFLAAERSRARTFLDEMGAHSGDAHPVSPQGLPRLVEECRDVCFVDYYQLSDRLLAWVVTDGKAELVLIPATNKDVQDAIQEFLNAIYLQSTLLKNRPQGQKVRWDAVQAAKNVYQMIFGPVASHLPAGKRVGIVPHRMLHYVPFQALHDGEKYLIERREIFYAPSATAYLELRKRDVAAAEGVLIFDPILSDDPKSPFARTESLALKDQYPDGSFILRKAATLAAFKQACTSAGVIHVSSHGSFNAWIPLESGLVFAGTGGTEHAILRAKDIYSMKLEKTRLLVMSACVSAVGDLSDGDEVTGLTRAFQVAGVPDVIGSLWPVENEATTQLMTLFHKSLAQNHDPITALQQAQVEMIGKSSTIAKWAPFVLTGVGKGMGTKPK